MTNSQQYYFSNNEKVYGPYTVDEFFSLKLPDSSYVCKVGDNEWIPVSEFLKSQKNAFRKLDNSENNSNEESKRSSSSFNLEKKQAAPSSTKSNAPKDVDKSIPVLVNTIDNTIEYPQEVKKNNTSYIVLAAIIFVAIFIFWKVNNSNNASNNSEVTSTVDTLSAIPLDTLASVDTIAVIDKLGEIYNNILSVSKIQETQIENLSLSDVIDYKNEMLARHGFAFDEPFLLEKYKNKEWYNPENNYLVATSAFNEMEQYNFTLLENKLKEEYAELSDIIKGFYSSIIDKTFDAKIYFSESVDVFITKSNMDPWMINEEMQNHYKEFTESKYEFSDPLQINLIKSENGINYISFKFYYSAYRVSKSKQQTCNVTVEWGLDRNQKISSYKEVKIENLKFSDAVINIDTTHL